jgi:DNA-binding phage protein
MGVVSPPSASYDSWLSDRLRDPAEAEAYLQAVLEDGDKDALILALRQIAEVLK